MTPKKVFHKLAIVLASLAASITLVAVGFGACLLPPVTQGLSQAFAQDDVSPFSREQLVQVADATRDFSFASHDELALLKVMYGVNAEYQDALEEAGLLPADDAPNLEGVTEADNLAQLRSAFAGASEAYCFPAETVSHLDDCHAVMAVMMPVLVCITLVTAAALSLLGMAGRRRETGVVLSGAGAFVLVTFAVLGIWAALDFRSLFRVLHQLLFSRGNWRFPHDSLLICAFPTRFWMGMGALWLATTISGSVACIVVGQHLRHA